MKKEKVKVKFHGIYGGITKIAKRRLSLNLTSLSISDGKNHLLLDAGSNKSIKDNNELKKINAILLSHTHIDHILHIWTLLRKTKKRVRIYTPTKLRLKNKNVKQTTQIPNKINTFKINHIVTSHRRKNYAYKISKNGKSICYTGDTSYFHNLAEFCKNTNVLICESTLSNKHKWRSKIRGHMTPETVIKLAKEAKPKLLILTHFSNVKPEEFLKEVKKGYNKKVIIAEEELEIKI